jgi:hypothetical protein
VKKEPFDKLYAPQFGDGNIIETSRGDTLFQISINEIKDDLVSVSYTYSRPAQTENPLHNPERPTTGATEITGAFWDEIAALKDLQQPFFIFFMCLMCLMSRL